MSKALSLIIMIPNNEIQQYHHFASDRYINHAERSRFFLRLNRRASLVDLQTQLQKMLA